jgi:hypothetical protein
MENAESLLLDLDEFNRTNEEDKQIPQSLENFIEHVAKTGTYIFPWNKIRKLYLAKLKTVLNNLAPLTNAAQSQLNTTNDTSLNTSNIFQNSYLNTTQTDSTINIQIIKDRITERMKSFTSAPFTIQRISELLLKPTSHYSRTDKFLRGLEKCVMVVTTVDPNGNKIFIENVFDSPVPSPERINEVPIVAITPVRPATPEPPKFHEATVMPAEAINDDMPIQQEMESKISEQHEQIQNHPENVEQSDKIEQDTMNNVENNVSLPSSPPPPQETQDLQPQEEQSNEETESMIVSTDTDPQ